MDDKYIVDLYWERDQKAISATEEKYGKYLLKIAFNILADTGDSAECVNDTYLCAWNSMPEHRPSVLSTYLGKITRQLSIDVFRKKGAQKRGCSQFALSLSELEDCVSGSDTTLNDAELNSLATSISEYLRSLSKEARTAFVCRYYFGDSLKDIAQYNDCSVSKIKSILYRTRIGLKEYLIGEGYEI